MFVYDVSLHWDTSPSICVRFRVSYVRVGLREINKLSSEMRKNTTVVITCVCITGLCRPSVSEEADCPARRPC